MQLPNAVRRSGRLLAAICVAIALTACADVPRDAASQRADAAARAGGEAAARIGDQVCAVFQSSDGAHWFGTKDEGLFRLVGRSLARFTTAHGLPAGQVRSIHEDRAGALFVCTDPGGVARFDGRAFAAVTAIDEPQSEWKLAADDLWFPGRGDSGTAYRWDGAALHRLAFPATAAGDAHYAASPRSLYPNMRYSPYDVYTVFRDANGDVWFGTALLGVCRFDGRTFAWASPAEIGLAGAENFGTRAIVQDRDGRFWFTTSPERFDALPSAPSERGTVALRYRKEPGAGTPDDPYSAFLSATRDANGDLLLATLGIGVWRFDGVRMTQHPITHRGEPIWIHCVYRDRDDVLWVGTQGHGVYRFDGRAFVPFGG